MHRQTSAKVALVGGNGFAGTHLAEQLVLRGAEITSYSRSGTRPAHLQDAAWAAKVSWQQGNGAEAQASWFENCEAVVSLVGAPPLPTFSKPAFEAQVQANSEANCQAIAAAAAAGVNKIVLMGADIPRILQSDKFGYYVGKQRSLQAAREFAESDAAHSATVLQPSSMYGTRHSRGGLPIPLGWFMAPMGLLLPGFFVSVKDVAACACDAALGQRFAEPGLRVIENREMRAYRKPA